MSKGSTRRPCCLTREAEQLQWDYAYGKITEDEYIRQVKELVEQDRWWKK